MKKFNYYVLIFIFLFGLLPFKIDAQNDTLKNGTTKVLSKIAFGLTLGSNVIINYISTSYENYGEIKMSPGLSLGLHTNFYNLTKCKRLFIQTGIFFNEYSFKLKFYEGNYPNQDMVWLRTYFQFIGANIKTSLKLFEKNTFSHYLGLNTSILDLARTNLYYPSYGHQLALFNSIDYILDYTINKKISLSLNVYTGLSTKPLIYTYISPYNEKIEQQLTLFVSGINFSIKYHITNKTK